MKYIIATWFYEGKYRKKQMSKTITSGRPNWSDSIHLAKIWTLSFEENFLAKYPVEEKNRTWSNTRKI